MKKFILPIALLAYIAIANGAVDSYLKLPSSAVAGRATCAAALRGLVWTVESGASTADYISVCRKNSDGTTDTYAWASFDLQ